MKVSIFVCLVIQVNKMVSWDIKVKFLGCSPHYKEIMLLAKQEKFSNVEEIISNDDDTHTLIVNNRGIEQTKFKNEVMK